MNTQLQEPQMTRLELIEEQPAPQTRELSSMPSQSLAVPENSPGGMMLAALAKGASLEQIEKMMVLHERWERREAEKAMVAAMAAFKSEPMTIYKRKRVGYETKEGEFVGYSHAELSDVTDVVGPAMAKHGLSFRWDIKQDGGRINVACIVTHKLGHSERVTMDTAPDTSGKKNQIQAISSAVTYMQRYTLLAITGMSTKGMDDDGAGAGDGDHERRRRQWLDDQKANIAEAATVGELKRTMDYALRTAQGENDQEAIDELLAASEAKVSKIKPAKGTQS